MTLEFALTILGAARAVGWLFEAIDRIEEG